MEILHGKLFVGASLRHPSPEPASSLFRSGCHSHPCPDDPPSCSSSVGLACSHLGSHHKRGCATLKHRPLSGGDQMTWRPASQLRPLWHRLRLATISQLCAAYQRARGPSKTQHILRCDSCSGPFHMQESSAWRLAACHRHFQADSRRAQRLAARARPEADTGGV